MHHVSLMRLLVGALSVIICTSGEAQPVNNRHFIRIYDDNDNFNLLRDGTDRYYTNGFKLEYYFFGKKKHSFPSNLLLGLSQATDARHTVRFTQNMFTPEDITKTDVAPGDWPYSGALYVSYGMTTLNSRKNLRLTSMIDAGVLGPWSLAAETQIFVHDVFDFDEPVGWSTQLRNSPIINYSIVVEPRLFTSGWLDVIGKAEVNAGTLLDQLRMGCTFRFGLKDAYFSSYQRKLQAFITLETVGGLVGYNAHFQGGILNNNDGLYTITYQELEKTYLEGQLSFMFSYQHLGLSYTQKFRTRQTVNSDNHAVGNVSFTWLF